MPLRTEAIKRERSSRYVAFEFELRHNACPAERFKTGPSSQDRGYFRTKLNFLSAYRPFSPVETCIQFQLPVSIQPPLIRPYG